MQCVNLSGSNEQMPIVGLGTWQATPEEIENIIDIALESGYRHIDTAFVYNNEEAIGNALKRWIEGGKIKREELFVTTKLPVFGNRAADVENFLRISLNRLKLTYVDLYLIHLPFALFCDKEILQPAKNEDGSVIIDFENDNLATWKVMEEQVRKGLVKAIGLSNFNENQVKEIYDLAAIKPAVLQIEMHAYLQQPNIVEVCNKLNIAITAYSPLGSPGAQRHFLTKYDYKIEDFPDLLHDPLILTLSDKYKKSVGQILLKHLAQKGIIVIPKSSNPQRIKDNIDVFGFMLEDEDIAKIDKLDKGEKGRIFNFLFFKDVDKHPQYPFKY
ncbi:PREDICTED: alcohol dehydrogenase [NADP(+)]-like [Nicrophorus vespilloides]|uniref:Alcohol dehydrogenase [NADP(+)]-like n=1 Tax=Nicrophorus vespilloides TaxID=110193 RepID=A0ABM1NB77_NICVS|nr:PREDICTED: alcohol dehydrogenase [NADP(+)]-like [Nicrophorus vespilloides]